MNNWVCVKICYVIYLFIIPLFSLENLLTNCIKYRIAWTNIVHKFRKVQNNGNNLCLPRAQF